VDKLWKWWITAPATSPYYVWVVNQYICEPQLQKSCYNAVPRSRTTEGSASPPVITVSISRNFKPILGGYVKGWQGWRQVIN